MSLLSRRWLCESKPLIPSPATRSRIPKDTLNVIEGSGENALKIYFESDESKKVYLEIETEHPGEDFTTNLDNPQPMGKET